MISFLSEGVLEAVAAVERVDSWMACRIGAIYESYQDYPSLASFYKSDEGGVLCQFGGNILLAGDFDGQELRDFWQFIGGNTMSGRVGSWLDGFRDCHCTETDIMVLDQHQFAKIPSLDLFPPRRRVFALLSEQSELGQEAELLEWMSDVALRQRKGNATIGLLEENATAGAYFIYNSKAIIGGVATAKGKEGQGLGSRAVKGIIASLSDQCKSFCVITQGDELVAFYEKMGFRKQGRHSYIRFQG